MSAGKDWVCGDCGNRYGDDVTACPNKTLDVKGLTLRALDNSHDPVCPQYRLLCTCPECFPPACMCALIKAVRAHDKEGVRRAFVDAKLQTS